jgi:hypothetical protein
VTFRVEQLQAKQGIASAEDGAAAPPIVATTGVAATPNPMWQRLSSAAPASTNGALTTPTRGGTSLRGANTNRRIELANANAQLQARSELAARILATIDPQHHDAVAAALENEILDYTAYRDSLA